MPADELEALARALDLHRMQYREDCLLHQLFEQRVACDPQRLALIFEEQRITYGELNAKANQLAFELAERGAGPDVLVGLYAERGIDLLIGMLAILKAGGAYVPIAPDYPPARVEYILKDAGVNIIVTQRRLAAAVAGSVRHLVCLDEPSLQQQLLTRSIANPCVAALSPRNLAYIIYTSGSTGQPKGVMIEHHNVVRLFRSVASEFDFRDTDTWIVAHSFAFDFSVWETWGALIHGGRLVIASQHSVRDAKACSELLQRHEVTVLNQTPTAFYALMQVRCFTTPAALTLLTSLAATPPRYNPSRPS